MKIQNLKSYNTNFMAHYYKIEPKSKVMTYISGKQEILLYNKKNSKNFYLQTYK